LVLSHIRRFEPLLRLLQTEGDRVADLQELVDTSLADLGGLGDWMQEPSRLLAISALIGFQTLRGGVMGPFEGVTDEEFIAALVDALPDDRPVGFPLSPDQQ
jgi:hypothetical protein